MLQYYYYMVNTWLYDYLVIMVTWLSGYLVLWLYYMVILLSRLTVVSREAKKKQHACASSGPRDHYSELFTRMAALKF